MEDTVTPEIPQEYQTILDDKSKETIHFFMPIEKSYVDLMEKNLEKGAKDTDPYSWKIGGLASSSDKDLDGEYIEPTAFDTDYLVRFGFFNNDHQKGPENKVGIPTKAVVTDKGLWVEGYLLKDIPAAQGIYRLMKTLAKGNHDRKVGFSVEGKIISQEGSRITKVFLKDIAITANPVNTKTYAELIKSMRENKKTSVVPEPDLKKNEESAEESSKESIPLNEIKEHVKVDKKHFEKISKLASEIAEESKRLMDEDKAEFDKALAAGTATGNNGPSGVQTDGQAMRVESLEKELKVTTNDESITPEVDPQLIRYTMEKSLINDEKIAIKIIEYARLLKLQNKA